MRTLFAGLFAIAALFGFSAEAAAQAQTSYYVAPAAATPAGNDSNACTSAAPCLTLQHTCSVIDTLPFGVYSLYVADGTYTSTGSGNVVCGLNYNHAVTITGDVTNPNFVVLQLVGNDTGIDVQDHAIVGINGVYITSSGANSNGIVSRQYTITDYNNVWFGQLSVDVFATEASKINCLSTVIISNMGFHAIAFGQSQILLNCPMRIAAGVAFSYFVDVAQESFVDASSLSATDYSTGGAPSVSGQKWVNSHSEIDGSTNLPGTGNTNAGHYEVNN